MGRTAICAAQSWRTDPQSRRRNTLSAGDPVPTIFTVIAPLTIGYTLQASPTLFWAIEKPVSYQIEISMFRPDREQPLFEKTFKIDKSWLT